MLSGLAWSVSGLIAIAMVAIRPSSSEFVDDPDDARDESSTATKRSHDGCESVELEHRLHGAVIIHHGRHVEEPEDRPDDEDGERDEEYSYNGHLFAFCYGLRKEGGEALNRGDDDEWPGAPRRKLLHTPVRFAGRAAVVRSVSVFDELLTAQEIALGHPSVVDLNASVASECRAKLGVELLLTLHHVVALVDEAFTLLEALVCFVNSCGQFFHLYHLLTTSIC